MKLAVEGLDTELRKKFEGMNFEDLVDSLDQATGYEWLFREENQRKNSSSDTYYHDPNYEIHWLK